MENVPAAEFKRRFSDYLGRVVFRGERFLITRRGRPVAEVSPAPERPRHIANAGGWLDDGDPFFKLVDSIVADRSKHLPRKF